MLIDSIKTQNDEPAHIAVQMFLEKMFKDHPYGKDLHGKIETVEKITQGDLKRHFSKMAMQKNLTVVVSGYVDPDKWMKGLSRNIRSLSVGSSYHEKFPLSPLASSERQFHELKKEQTHIVMGYRGIDLKDERRYTLNVLQSILAGQGGRLFLELRDKASLAYSVSPIRFDGLESGYFGAYIGCSPEKGKKSIEMMKAEFEKICEIKPDEAEIERAKRYLIGRHDIELQRNSAFASSILSNEIFGISKDEIFEFPDKIRAVTPSDVRTLAESILKKPEILVAVGNQCPW